MQDTGRAPQILATRIRCAKAIHKIKLLLIPLLLSFPIMAHFSHSHLRTSL